MSVGGKEGAKVMVRVDGARNQSVEVAECGIPKSIRENPCNICLPPPRNPPVSTTNLGGSHDDLQCSAFVISSSDFVKLPHTQLPLFTSQLKLNDSR